MKDPWDEDPSAIDEDEGKLEDPDEILARALWRSRHQGGSHLLGDWRGLYHGLRAGNLKMRAEAEAAVRAERAAFDRT